MQELKKIQIVESKIEEIKTLLTHWTQKIQNYHSTLEQLTKQLTEIKENTN